MIKYRAGKILSEKEYIEYVTISIKKRGERMHTSLYTFYVCILFLKWYTQNWLWLWWSFHCYHFVLFKYFSMRLVGRSTLVYYWWRCILVENSEFWQCVRILKLCSNFSKNIHGCVQVLAKMFTEALFRRVKQ